MKIDWSKAPEGATHYDPTVNTPTWYRKKGFAWEYYYGGEWMPSANKPDYNERLTPHPVVTAWRGPQDGLPPVGTEVETRAGMLWQTGTVVAHVREACFRDMAIIQCEGFWAASDATGIRPIQSDRDRAIEEMLKVKETIYGGNDMERRQMAALYDAGYRKGEPTCSTK